MKAQEVIERMVKEGYQSKVVAIGLLDNRRWWYMHRDEEIPEDGEIALKINELEWR